MNGLSLGLTQAQIALIQKETQRRLCRTVSKAPIARLDLERDISELYRLSAFKPPDFVWCRSPLEATATAALIWMIFGSKADTLDWKSLRKEFRTDWWQNLIDQLVEQLSESVCQRLRSSFARCVSPTHSFSVWWQILPELELTVSSVLKLRQFLESETKELGLTVQADPCALPEQRIRLMKRRLEFMMVQNQAALQLGFDNNEIATSIMNTIKAQSSTIHINVPLRALLKDGPLVIKNQIERIAWPVWNYAWAHEYFAIRDVLGRRAFSEKFLESLSILEGIVCNSFAWIVFPGLCILSERPVQITIDDQLRLHNQHDSAISFRDGTSYYSWHGANVPSFAILDRETLTVQAIMAEQNVASRRALVDIFGVERFLVASSAKLIDVDGFGALYRAELAGDEPLVMVKVVNPSPEPDGTYKDYFLRVPPHITTAREAVAWTFGFEENNYSPDIQT